MAEVPCVLLTETTRVQRNLRRFRFGSVGCLHNAMICLDTVESPESILTAGDYWPHDDPRWPTKCEKCGEPFLPTDAWQLFPDRLYLHPTAGEVTIHNAPVGSMWNSHWMPPHWCGPDGKCWTVKLPDGNDWMIDGPSGNGGGAWSRSGVPPNLTVTPSILTPGYHGFLTGGVLRSC